MLLYTYLNGTLMCNTFSGLACVWLWLPVAKPMTTSNRGPSLRRIVFSFFGCSRLCTWPEGRGGGRRAVFLHDFTPVQRHPQQPRATVPSQWGFQFPFFPGPPKKMQTKEKDEGKSRRRNYSLRADPARPPLPLRPDPPPSRVAALPPPAPPYSPSSEGARVTILRTFVSRREVRTAGVARSSWNSSLTAGARGFPLARPPEALGVDGWNVERRVPTFSASQTPHGLAYRGALENLPYALALSHPH